ncbi:MAG: hypothetical protein ACI4J4_04820 [Ruminiclostridium sp.]
MNHGSVNYGDICCTGLLDADFELLWTDSKSVIDRILPLGSKLKKDISSAAPAEKIYHDFVAAGINYCAVFEKISYDMTICRIYREKLDDNSISALMNGVDTIKHETLNFLSLVGSLKQGSGEEKSGSFSETLSAQSYGAETIYNECLNIQRAVGGKTGKEYLPIRKRLLDTFYRLTRLTSSLNKRLLPVITIENPYVCTDYMSVEEIICNLAKIFFMCSPDNSRAELEIYEDNGFLVFRSEFPAYAGFDIADIAAEIKTVKSIFSYLGGGADFKDNGDTISFSGSFPTEFTSDSNLVSEENRLEFEYNENDSGEGLYKAGENGDSFFSPKLYLKNVELWGYMSIILGSITNYQ